MTVFHDRTAQGDTHVFPLSLSQEGLWILDQVAPDSILNTLSSTLHIYQPLSPDVLERSLNALIQRHDTLRTTFQMIEERPFQIVGSSVSISLPVFYLEELPREQREAEIRRLTTEEQQRRFDLTKGPLLRASLLQLGAEEYLLLLNLHSIVCDEWSLGVCLRELVSLYEGFTHGQSSPLPEPSLPYTDFVLQQQAWLNGDIAAEQIRYWKGQLAESLASLDLPTDRPRQPVPTLRGSTYDLTLSRKVSEALKTLSQCEQVSLEVILLAAWQTLLYRYSGQEDLLIGTIADRTSAEHETAIGFFKNILVVRTMLTGDLSFRTLLERVRTELQQAHMHQELPFEYLVKELHPVHALGQYPFFQAMFTLAQPLPSLAPGWVVEQMELGAGTSRADLSLNIEEGTEGLQAGFNYSSDLFDAATIARLAGHWQTLLAGIVANPDQSLSGLPLLSEQEREQLLVEWNTPQIEYFQNRSVHELFEQQVERTPEAVAIICERKSLTYRELNQRANQLAHHLRSLGIQTEVPVGICVERSLEMVVGLLAILKAGGVHVPLDPTYAPERIAFMAEDTGMQALVTQQHLLERLPVLQSHLVCIDSAIISEQPITNLVHEVTGENLAYVIYTSGSTGQPKGVLIEHHALAAHCGAIIQVQGLSADDCTLQFNSFTFDASLEQIFPPLLVGARLVLRGPEVWSPSDLLRAVKEWQLTVITMPCDYWHEVITEWVAVPEQLEGQRLRLVVVGGDRLPPDAVQLWRQSPLHETRLFNVYGPTEATVTTTIFDIPRQIEREQPLASIPIGRPLPNRTIYILDKIGQPVPEGVAGELYIGGDLLARGYLNQPEITAERFVRDPFSQQPQARLYKTGDLARYRPGGIIEFLGRNDHQIKIRGYRVEPGEIETVIKLHPAVQQALVIMREDMPGVKRLVAYVVAQPSQDSAQLIAQVRGQVKEHLPNYMLPSAFVLLEAFPLNSSGKVDRHVLPAPEQGRSGGEENYIAPRLPIERQLVQIWEEMLNVRPIGIRDDFFELGGDSLLAVRVFERIAQACGKKLPLSTLFAGATIEHVATVLVGDTMVDDRAPVVVVQAGGSRPPFFYLHGEWKGGGLYSRELARHLGSEQPFYLLEPYKFENSPVLPTFEEMATAHLEAMRSVQAEGPYFLSGYCNGALLAYEMSRQLLEQGQEVGLLLLMDPDFPARHGEVRSTINRLCGILHISEKKQFDAYLSLQHVYRYLRFARYRNATNVQLADKVEEAEAEGRKRKVGRLELKALLPKMKILRQNWENIYDWLVASYTPGLYPGKITFFWTSEEPRRSDGWQKVMDEKQGDIEVYYNPGNHISGRTEYLPVLAERLRECLTKAQANVERG